MLNSGTFGWIQVFFFSVDVAYMVSICLYCCKTNLMMQAACEQLFDSLFKDCSLACRLREWHLIFSLLYFIAAMKILPDLRPSEPPLWWHRAVGASNHGGTTSTGQCGGVVHGGAGAPWVRLWKLWKVADWSSRT